MMIIIWSACIFCSTSQEKKKTHILQKADCQDRWYLRHTVKCVSARCLGEMWPSQNVISQQILQNKFIRNSRDFGQSLKPQNACHDRSTFVLVMACCCQTTSHPLNQNGSISMSQYCANRRYWVNSIVLFMWRFNHWNLNERHSNSYVCNIWLCSRFLCEFYMSMPQISQV